MSERIHVYGHDDPAAYLYVGSGANCVAIAPSRRLQEDLPTVGLVFTSDQARRLGLELVKAADRAEEDHAPLIARLAQKDTTS